MEADELSKNIVNTLVKKDFSSVQKYMTFPNNNNITDKVRESFKKMSDEEIREIQDFLYNLLNSCYNGELLEKSYTTLENIDEKKLFLLKENVIYYLGRLPIIPDIGILKKAYLKEENFQIKLNLTFSSLITFDETLEKDFINKIKPGNEYDLLLRSWTMAFFANSNNPYEYRDNQFEDWTRAKEPRIKRLAINYPNEDKFLKAMSFRALDLVVLDLFLQNRKNDILSKEETSIINNAFIDYEKFSAEKRQYLNDLKCKIVRQFSK